MQAGVHAHGSDKAQGDTVRGPADLSTQSVATVRLPNLRQ